jgi:hypothetical protein
MSEYFYTAWADGVTQYKAEHMNAPLGTIDAKLYDVSGEAYTISGELATHLSAGNHDWASSLSQETGAGDAEDQVMIYDDSATAYKRVKRYDFNDTGQSYGIGIYDMGIALSGSPTNSQVMCTYPMPRSVTFPYDCGLSRAAAGTAATAQTVFSLKKDGVEFATCTFAASGTTGTYSGEQTAFTAGNVFTIVAPASADATLADIGFAIAAIRIT